MPRPIGRTWRVFPGMANGVADAAAPTGDTAAPFEEEIDAAAWAAAKDADPDDAVGEGTFADCKE